MNVSGAQSRAKYPHANLGLCNFVAFAIHAVHQDTNSYEVLPHNNLFKI